MKTAKDFAAAAGYISQIAQTLDPADNAPFPTSRKLAVFHLRNAARITREIAEALAKQEEPAP